MAQRPQSAKIHCGSWKNDSSVPDLNNWLIWMMQVALKPHFAKIHSVSLQNVSYERNLKLFVYTEAKIAKQEFGGARWH